MVVNNENSDNISNEIKIFSNNDEKLKFLGKILNNDSSREILLLLIEKQMTANEISLQTKLSLPLILHHINQMIQAEIVSVSKIENNSKNQPMKYYFAKTGILILPEKTITKANNSKSLFRSLKGIIKFAMIGISGITTWFLTSSLQEPKKDYQDWGPSGISIDQLILSSVTAVIVIIVLYWIIIKKKKRG